jgi:precorrin-3B synthase
MIRGHCPGVHDPMLSGDGWLVRIKPPAARLSAAAATALAAASLAGGNGIAQVTQRGNLQFRGFSRASAREFAAVAVAHGVAERDPRAERNRRVVASPLGSAALAHSVEASVAEFSLADKFSVLLDDSPALRLENCPADVSIRVAGEQVRFGLAGATHVAFGTTPELLRTLEKILQVFADLSDGEGRMQTLLHDIGETMFFAAAGLQPAAAPAPTQAGPIIGDLGEGIFGVAVAYGQIDARVLAALAAFCARHADGLLRTTPWRSFLLTGVAEPDRLAAFAQDCGLITDREDVRLSITICPGRPACSSGLADTQMIADLLAASQIRFAHVSGCRKGCAHPRPSPITIVGESSGLSLIRDGCAADPAEASALSPDDIVAGCAA